MKSIILTFSLLGVFFSNVNFSQAPITEICLVSVDTTSSSNLISWERSSQISAVGIDSMLIYRRTLGGNDSLIATVEYDSLSDYYDTSANPNLRAYTYRIAGKDINGAIGSKSLPARTIHFAMIENAAGELWLKWTPYIGKPIDYYQCWDKSLGFDSLLNSTVNNVDTAWNFGGAVPQTTYQMVVDVAWTSGCTSTKANHNTTRSNQAGGVFLGTGSTASVTEASSIQEIFLAPNPAQNMTKLVFSSLTWEPIFVSIVDMQGRIVKRMSPVKVLGQHSMDINVGDLSNGLYNIVIDNGTINTYRLMKN